MLPIILSTAAWRAWLGEEEASEEQLSGAADGLPGRADAACPVDIRVGNARNNDAGADRAARAPPGLVSRLMAGCLRRTNPLAREGSTRSAQFRRGDAR